MEYKKYRRYKTRHRLSAPFTYGMIIPFIFIDISAEIYHHICFRLWKIPLVKRSEYIKIDRHKLEYLNYLDKLNCAYCGYGNGLINYIRTIAAETELYWCGIKHKKDSKFIELDYHKDFIDYGDEEAYKKLSK